MAEKGRQRIELQLRNAHVVGRFFVHHSHKDLSGRLDRLTAKARPAPPRRRPAGGHPAPAHRPSAATPSAPASAGSVASAPAAPAAPTKHEPAPRPAPTGAAANGADRPITVPSPAVAASPATAAAAAEAPATAASQWSAGDAGPALNLAIPEYDTLSASQVVRRLDGLGPDELDAVRRHESAGRMRRTILHRVEQLLNPDEPPGAPHPPA